MSCSADPHFAVCPNYASERYVNVRRMLADETGMTEDLAIVLLKDMWRTDNEEEKLRWNRGVRSDTAAPAPRFLPINRTLGLFNKPPKIPSAAIMATLREGGYVLLCYFTTGALIRLDENAELGLPPDTTKIPPEPKRDADLTMVEFGEATYHLLQLLPYVGWPEDWINMFRDFWANICKHRFWNSVDPAQMKALLLYQDQQRRRWHALCASATNSAVIYNLAVINESVLRETEVELANIMRMKKRRMEEEEEEKKKMEDERQWQKLVARFAEVGYGYLSSPSVARSDDSVVFV
ncbi:hypothetical protein BDN70DRAFT_587488 [Pholiota conissans]|uniref:Uncharacterized protein n=1 Tax=Pholiota conissans TaxID=109636 RepID=A0A9P6D721_9AGAR|nr:hypothetical protein BDN70DRAFT_587488 [Pholiota conissans]